MIKISVPNDDHVALRAMAKALEEIAVARGAPAQSLNIKNHIHIGSDDESLARLQQATSDLMQAAPAMMRENDVDGSIEIHGKRKEVEPDTTAQQVESLAVMQNFDETSTFAEIAEAAPTTDSTDTPWDERIHSASKALNADGTWRLRRKPKEEDEGDWLEYVAKVRDELLGQKPDEDALQSPLYELSPGHIGVMRPEPPVTPPGDDFHVDAGVVTEQQVADIPPPPPVPVPAPPVKVYGGDMTFPQVMAYLTERHGRISNAQVEQIIAEMGLKSIMDLNTQPEHTGPFIARVKALLGE